MARSKWEQVKDKLVLVEGWARDGLNNEQIASNLGISVALFYKYQKEHVEFLETLKKGKEIVDYQVENALLKSALSGNVTAQIYWLNNRKPRQWKNRRESDQNSDEISKVEQLLNRFRAEAQNGNN